MFDKNTYSKELTDSKNALDNLRDKYFAEMVKAKTITDYKKSYAKYNPLIVKAEKRYAREHDKYCDKYGLENQKITENWSKFWK